MRRHLTVPKGAGAQGVRWAAGWFLVVAAAVILTVWQASVHLEPAEAGLQSRVRLEHADGVLGPWLYWDGGAFNDIARNGYTEADVEVFEDRGQARVAFFPGYPAVSAAIGTVVGDIGLGQILVTFLSGLALAVVLHGWFSRWLTPAAARLASLAFLLFPWAYVVVGAGYGDALFLLCTVGAFALLERDRPLAAGLAGAVATGIRFVGVALVIGLVVRIAERRGAFASPGHRFDWRRLRRTDGLVLVASLGLLGFMAFCWSRYDDPFAFATAQRGWNQESGPQTWFKELFLDLVLHHPDRFFVLRLTAQAVALIIFCAAIPAVWRRFGPGYGSYTLVTLGLPAIGSAAFASQGRYVLAAFPVFALLGDWLAGLDRGRQVAYLAASGASLLLVASWWGRGYWMS